MITLLHLTSTLKNFLFQIIENVKNPVNNIARDTACRSDYPLDWERDNAIPNDYNVHLGEEEECNRYWREAERVMNMFQKWRLYREFKAAYQIKISELGVTCYRPELFANQGWCKLASDERKWGFCSSSCKVDYMQVKL